MTGPRTMLAAGSLLTTLGIAIAATSPIAGTDGSQRAQAQQLFGGAMVVVGWGVLAWGIHRFGRERE